MQTYSVVFNFCVIVAIINFVDCNSVNLGRRNQAIAECVNGYKSSWTIRDPEQYITTSQFARKKGYPAEEHLVVTEDGYVLTLHRIPGRPGAPAIFLQHPLTASSFHWLVTGKKRALGFILANAGYDVWMGNARGTTYSRCHTKYQTSSFEFWDFSWHEIGVYDLTAMISYVTKMTGQRVSFIGHSMGTTEFFVMASERPEIASMVKVMIALGPTAYLDHGTSPLLALTSLSPLLEYYINVTGTGEFLSSNQVIKTISKNVCSLTMQQRKTCALFVALTIGFNLRQFDYTLIPPILSHAPAGTSIKSYIHYAQVHDSKRFQHYDHGAKKNLKLYNSIEPPIYNISKITVPVALFWSDSDIYANPIDVLRLHRELPNAIPHYHIEDTNFNHGDFLFANNAPKLVYEKLLSALEDYN